MAHKKKKKQKKKLHKIKRDAREILIGAISGTIAGTLVELIIHFFFN